MIRHEPVLAFVRTRCLRTLALAVAAVMLCGAPASAQGDEPSIDAKVLDVAFLRPIGLMTFLAGSAVFIATMPLPYLFGGEANVIDEANDRLFRETARYVFERPLGDF